MRPFPANSLKKRVSDLIATAERRFSEDVPRSAAVKPTYEQLERAAKSLYSQFRALHNLALSVDLAEYGHEQRMQNEELLDELEGTL